MGKLLAIVACGAVAIGILGCGDDDDGGGTATGGATGTTTGATTERTTTGGAAQSRTVTMKDIRFVPANITVAEGTTVTWTNDDSVDHNVTKQSGPGPDFRSDDFGQGGTYEHRFDTPGTIDYTCTLHPGMDGKVTVR